MAILENLSQSAYFADLFIADEVIWSFLRAHLALEVSTDLLSAMCTLNSILRRVPAEANLKRTELKLIAADLESKSEHDGFRGAIEFELECLDRFLQRTQNVYPDGVQLLYDPKEKGLDCNCDIVFIHGVSGHPTTTWVNSANNIVWPSEWIPKDFPECRVLTLGYEMYLSGWYGSSLPLKEQAVSLLNGLQLSALGKRPIVFVTHSFGGLLAKEMLRYSYSHPVCHSPHRLLTSALQTHPTKHKGDLLLLHSPQRQRSR